MDLTHNFRILIHFVELPSRESGFSSNENAISYSDKVPATGKTGDVVFNRKPEVKNGRVIIGWYCVSGGKTPRWCPLSFDAAEKK